MKWTESLQTNRSLIIFYISSFLYFSAYLLIFWPGLFSGDTFCDVHQAVYGQYKSWGSYLYYKLTSLQFSISKHPAIMGLTQITFICFCLTRVFQLCQIYKIKKIFILLNLLVFFLPLNSLLTIFYSRDFWAGWTNILIFIELFNITFKYVYLKQEPSAKYLFLISALIVTSALLRFENYIFIPLTFIIYNYLNFFKTKKKLLMFFIILILFSVIFYKFIYPMSRNNDNYVLVPTRLYIVSALINPLSYIIKNNYDLAPDQKKAIDKVVPVKLLYEKYSAFEIEPFHERLRQGNIEFTNSSFKNFLYTTFEIFSENFLLFLRNRTSMFFSILGLKNTYYFSNRFYELNPSKYASELRKKFKGIWPEKNYEILGNTKNFVYSMGKFNKNFGILLNSAIVGFILSIFLLFKIKKFPATGWASLFISSRLVIIFFTAPASHFKYIYSLYIFGFVGILTLYIEMRVKKNLNE